MLKTTSQTEKDSFSITFDDLDENSLSELSSDEASEVLGGFKIRNDSGSSRRFYTFGAFVDPKVQLLQPGETGDYDGEYILFNSSRTAFRPTLSSKLGSDDIVRFALEGDRIAVGPGFVFSLTSTEA
jgi:hypothetical protein